jgi:hypothetical protein
VAAQVKRGETRISHFDHRICEARHLVVRDHRIHGKGGVASGRRSCVYKGLELGECSMLRHLR